MVRKYICPACGIKSGVNIEYGYPSSELMEASERGEVALGGCCIGDNDPERRCLHCGHEWRIKRRSADLNALVSYLEDRLMDASVGNDQNDFKTGFLEGFRSAVEHVIRFQIEQDLKTY